LGAVAPAVITGPAWTLADRLKTQQERNRNQEWLRVGRLTTVVLERQMSTKGLSQSKPRFSNPKAAKQNINEAMMPFSEWQAQAWSKLTLDWLTYKNGPMLAISRDRHDLLLPHGVTPLPNIPDPSWYPKAGRGDIAPRVPQLLEDRAYGILPARNGQRFLVFQPVIELCVFVGQGNGGFGRIRCMTDPSDHTHSALLIDPDSMQGYFVGGSFHAGF
jgi:hypothetical protein